MLSTPLRRCAITTAILPKAVMFRLAAHRSLDEINAVPSPLAKDWITKERELRIRFYRARANRSIRRKVKPALLKTLMKRQRMLKHKVVTSQTEESRARFAELLAHVKTQIAALQRPRGPAPLLPTGMASEPVVRTGEDGTEQKLYPSGRGLWCVLQPFVARMLLERRGEKRFRGLPADLIQQLGRQLEERVEFEADRLRRRIERLAPRQAAERGWLVRRLRSQEVRDFVADGQRVRLRDENEVRLAAILQANATQSLDRSDERLDDPHAFPIYCLERMVTDDEIRSKLAERLRGIAVEMHRKIRKHRLRSNAETRGEARLEKEHATSLNQVSNPSEEEKTLQPAQGPWPRLHVIRQDPLTVDLCIALWRLNTWRTDDMDDNLQDQGTG